MAQEKTELMDIKKFEEKDWRGIFAAASLVLVGLSMFFRPEHMETVVMLASMALTYYFQGRSEK